MSSCTVRSFVVPFALAPLLIVTACATTQPAVAPAAGPAPGMAVEQVHAQPLGPSTGTVAIADDIRKACGIQDQDAYFAFDSAALESTDVAPLDAVARCFSTGPLKGRGMKLVGHTDPRGTPEYNVTLGQSRADSVGRYLGKHGVPQSQVATTSRGAIDASGHDESGWTRDRRVDVTLSS